MSKMLNILQQLESTSSRNEKIDILKNLTTIESDMFQYMAHQALDPRFDYYIKNFDMPDYYLGTLSLDFALMFLNDLDQRLITGNEARDKLYEIMSKLTEEDAEVFKRVVKRDLRCGVSAKTINKVWPDAVYIHPYMRASSFSTKNLSKLKYPCISQTKMDGLYCDIIIDGGTVTYMTRNGSILPFDLWNEEMIEYGLDDIVLQGEMLAVDGNGEIMDRALSNGYVNSDDVDQERLRFYCWDAIPLEDFRKKKCTIPYEQRLTFVTDLKQSQEALGDWFGVVDTMICETASTVLWHFKNRRFEGEEGTIVKNTDMVWKDGTSKDQIKVKIIAESELEIVNIKEGTGKYVNMLGAIECKSNCGAVKVSVGTGFSDSQRKDFWSNPEEVIGKVATIRYNDLITNENDRDIYSLFLPRFIEIRTDKDNADDRSKILEDIETPINTLKFVE